MGNRIIGLQMENIKRIKVIDIRPQGPMVVVSGRNAQGKTSLLDGIEMVLRGEKAIPEKPMRRGSRKAKIQAEIGDKTVEFTLIRKFTESGSTLTVLDESGKKVESPQTLLSALYSSLTFDPLAFTRMDARKQIDTIRAIAGLDFTALDAKRKAAFERRTDVNREVTRLEGQLRSMPTHADAPKGPVNVAELIASLRRVEAANQDIAAKWQDARDRRRMAADGLATAEREAERLASVIDELERRLTLAKADAGKQAMKVKEARETIEALGDEQPRPEFSETQSIQDMIVRAETDNRQVRENAARAATAKALRDQQLSADKLTSAIEACDEEKRVALDGAKFPIPGMAFDETGVTLNGLPFDQGSSAEQLRASVAIGMASNPKLRVMLIRDGSLLDEEGMELMAMIATENDAQLWVERVSSDGAVGIVIEDGEVVEPSTEQQPLLPV